MIAHKNIKNTVEKWYCKILGKHGCKLLTKKPKKENMLIIATIVINHPVFDGTLRELFVYIVKTMCTFNDGTTLIEQVNDTSDKFEQALSADECVSIIGKPCTYLCLLLFTDRYYEPCDHASIQKSLVLMMILLVRPKHSQLHYASS